MPYDHNDAAELLDQNAALRRQHDALTQALINATGASLAAEFLGDRDYGPIFARRLGVSFTDKGNVDVHVLSETGRAAKHWDSKINALVPVSFDGLAAELKGKWSTLPWLDKTGDHKPERKPEPKGNLTDSMRAAKAEQDRLAARPFSPAETGDARRPRIVLARTFNLTAQMKIARRDRALAIELERAAQAA
jgi:hypothetical protein